MAKSTTSTPTPPAVRSKKYVHAAPEFVSLKEGESVTGIFMARVATQFGPGYRMKIGNSIKVLSGNRTQLDALFDDLMINDDFPSGLTGHLLKVSRLRGNIKTKAGRTVGQYEIEHIFDGCPHGCQPAS